MRERRESAWVHLDAAELGPTALVGALSHDRVRGRSALSFEYDQGWLASGAAFLLDPGLALFQGPQHPTREQFGIFLDASGARRMGGWSTTASSRRRRWRGSASSSRAHASSRSPARRSDRPTRWLALLTAPGSSLGGARPKASFTDEDGSLWLAKFSSREDRRDVGAWEFILHEMAAAIGIRVPEARPLALSPRHRTFCARRFDRAHGTRRMFASAMTLLERTGGDRGSYLDLAQLLQDQGAAGGGIEADLAELFRRLVFNVLVGNRDDHLRNHVSASPRGGGWRPPST